MMDITHIINGIHTTPFQTGAQAEKASEVSFSSMLQEALGQVVSADYADKVSGLETIAGADVDIHSVMIDAQKAEILLNLIIQIRNKLVESYQEIMRMQI